LGEGSRKESGDRFKLVLEGSGLTDDQGQTGQTEGDRFHLVLEGSGLTDDQGQTGQTRQTEDQGRAKEKGKSRTSAISNILNH
jgi:hypothetical protein